MGHKNFPVFKRGDEKGRVDPGPGWGGLNELKNRSGKLKQLRQD